MNNAPLTPRETTEDEPRKHWTDVHCGHLSIGEFLGHVDCPVPGACILGHNAGKGEKPAISLSRPLNRRGGHQWCTDAPRFGTLGDAKWCKW